MNRIYRTVTHLLLVSLLWMPTLAFSAEDETVEPARQDPKARELLDAAKVKLKGIQSLKADFQQGMGASFSTHDFDREKVLFLARPNRFRVEHITGAITEKRVLTALSDGKMVTGMSQRNFIAYERPVRQENFYLGQNFLVQFFFEHGPISFDPSAATWGRPISLFDSSVSAYDRDVQLRYLGWRVMDGERYDVVEIKYNTLNNDIRQQIYLGEDKLVYQVDNYFDGLITSQKFRNYRLDVDLPPETWSRVALEKMPLVEIDPVRMGAEAPDFTLPGHDGGEFTMKEMLKGKKGMFICTLDGTAGKYAGDADVHLEQMRIVQEIKDKFEQQGLMVVAIVGGPEITPELKEEMMLSWMPDVSRFDYPVLIDIDLERGIQGAAYQNFNLKGRNNLLLDSEGKVVFASRDFKQRVNELALYQALAQIGFNVSAADLEERRF